MVDQDNNSGADNSTILELYKLHVEMADRVSQRRGVTNNWFITMHVAIFSLGGVVMNRYATSLEITLLLLSFLGAGLSWIWGALITSYKQLNSAKFKVINKIEEDYLPITFYVDEYKHYKKDKRRDFSQVEKWLPRILMGLYMIGFVVGIVILVLCKF